MRLEVVLGIQTFSQDTVVVNFAIDSQGEGSIFVNEGLGTGVCPYHSQQSNPDISSESKGRLTGKEEEEEEEEEEIHIPRPTILRRS